MPHGGGDLEWIATTNFATGNPTILGDYLYWTTGFAGQVYRCRY